MTTPPSRMDAQPIKDHVIREAVNELTKIARDYHDTQQLRERIAYVVLQLVNPAQPIAGAVDEKGTEAWLIEWDDTHGHRKAVFRHNAIGDYRAMFEGAISYELVKRDAAITDSLQNVEKYE